MTRLGLLALLAVAACTPPASGNLPTDPDPDAPFTSVDDYETQVIDAFDALNAEIHTEAGTVEACRVVAVSEQACGGPTMFSIYSAESSDRAEVERLAAAIVALNVKANRQFEWASTCMAYPAPTPVLREGRCVEP